MGRQLRVAHRMLDIPMPQPRLQSTGIVPLIGKLVTAAVAQHVGMDCEGHAGPLATLDQGMEAFWRQRRTALGHEHVRAGPLFALQPPQPPQLVAL